MANYSTEQNLRLAQALLSKQGEINRLTERAEQAEAELERLRAGLAKETKRLEYAQGRLQDADTVSRGLRAALDKTEDERDVLKVAVDHTAGRMSTLELWAHRELTGETLHNVLSVITNLRDALDAPESNEENTNGR